ncbi:hypothetical protein OAL67_00845 [bacterium]|nr:hypothetical protein [bacterium]
MAWRRYIAKNGRMKSTMRVYIGYKYSKIPNKKALINTVEGVASQLEKQGHKVFVLGRDVQNWGKTNLHILRKAFTIIKNLVRADRVLAIVTQEVSSKGLLFEMTIARILGKDILVALKNGVEDKKVQRFATQTITFQNPKDIRL